MSLEIFLFYILLVDSLGANLLSWFGGRWYMEHFNIVARWFPASKGWSALYLLLVLWVGKLLGIY